MKTFFLILFSLLIALTAKADETIQVNELAKTSQSWNQTPLPHYGQGTPEVTVLQITIPPKTKLPLHKHPVINAGFVLQGELTVVGPQQQTLNLKQGDTIIELVNQWHYGINKGNQPVKLIVFYAGNKGVPLTIKKQ